MKRTESRPGPAGNKPLVVGIAGGSASGKSTVAERVVRLIGPARTARLHHDAYYHDLSHLTPDERLAVNVDHPDSLETSLLVEHVHALLDDREVDVPTYDYVTMTRRPDVREVRPAPLILLEGLLILHDERLRTLMDVIVFVDAPERERLARRIARDVDERGRSPAEVVAQHELRVQPMHERFVEPTRAFADVVLRGGGHNREAVESLVRRIEVMLESGGKGGVTNTPG